MKAFDKDRNIRRILSGTGKSPFRLYKELTFGNGSLHRFLLYELMTFCLGSLPGGLGIFLRRKLYPRMFGECGTGLIVGRNSTFRHPNKVKIGTNVTIDDNCVIDARGSTQSGITIEDGVLINRNTMIQSKAGDIRIGKSVGIGANSLLVSWDGIEIGEGSAIAAGCYVSAGSYRTDDPDKPILEQEAYVAGPIVIERNVWIATRVTILDGVSIGHDSIISAGSVVATSIAPRSVAHGNPAKVILRR
jgi:acetyltransferase-like isoleucine patch superfamily enzyme